MRMTSKGERIKTYLIGVGIGLMAVYFWTSARSRLNPPPANQGTQQASPDQQTPAPAPPGEQASPQDSGGPSAPTSPEGVPSANPDDTQTQPDG